MQLFVCVYMHMLYNVHVCMYVRRIMYNIQMKIYYRMTPIASIIQIKVTLDFGDGSIGGLEATFVFITLETNQYSSPFVTGVQNIAGHHILGLHQR